MLRWKFTKNSSKIAPDMEKKSPKKKNQERNPSQNRFLKKSQHQLRLLKKKKLGNIRLKYICYNSLKNRKRKKLPIRNDCFLFKYNQFIMKNIFLIIFIV